MSTEPKIAYVSILLPSQKCFCHRCSADDHDYAVLRVDGGRQYCESHAIELLHELADVLDHIGTRERGDDDP